MSNDDIDLDALLESALDDFNSEPEIPITRSIPSSSSSQINSNDNINISTSSNSLPNSSNNNNNEDDEFAELLKNPMKALTNLLSDPKMKEEFEKDFGGLMSGMKGDSQGFSLDNLQKELENIAKDIPDEIKQNETPINESKPTSTQSSPQQDNLQSTLENLMNNAKDLQDSDDFGEENIMNMFKDLENNPEVQNMVESMMEKFMSKEVLYEGLTELQVKFQEWLNKKEKEGNVSEEELTKYKLQIDAISRVLAIYDANENDENTTAEAEKLMKQMEIIGTLPEEVLAEIGKPGLGDAPCTIM